MHGGPCPGHRGPLPCVHPKPVKTNRAEPTTSSCLSWGDMGDTGPWLGKLWVTMGSRPAGGGHPAVTPGVPKAGCPLWSPPLTSPGSGAGGASALQGVLEQSWGQGCHLLGTSVSSPTPGQDPAGRELTASLGVTKLGVTPPDSSSMGRCHLYSMFA